jgi:protein phosphatase 1 regulatory subunit 7
MIVLQNTWLIIFFLLYIDKLTKLRRLDVQSNRLTKVENLTAQQETLEELYLAHNGIDDEGASQESGLALNFPQLNVLDLSRNQVTNTKSFAHLEALEELWLSGNKVNELGAMLPLKDSASAGIQNLETLYLEYNPVASDPLYRKSLAEWIPSLTQIDADLIGGLGAHGMQSAAVSLAPTVSLEEQMRQLQTTALEKAQEETQAYKVGQNQ